MKLTLLALVIYVGLSGCDQSVSAISQNVTEVKQDIMERGDKPMPKESDYKS